MLAVNRIFLNRDNAVIYVPKALTLIISVYSLCYNFLTKNYCKVFCSIYKWTVLSIPCKQILGRCNLIREGSRLSPVLTDFYMPVLTQATIEFSPHWISVKSVTYKQVSSAKRARVTRVVLIVSFVNK
jgi:hypothetical protein